MTDEDREADRTRTERGRALRAAHLANLEAMYRATDFTPEWLAALAAVAVSRRDLDLFYRER